MSDQDLPVLGNSDLGARQGPADGPQLEVALIGHVGDAGGFGHTVSFADRDADALKKFEDIVRDGRRPGETQTDPVKTQPFFQFPEDREMGQRKARLTTRDVSGPVC